MPRSWNCEGADGGGREGVGHIVMGLCSVGGLGVRDETCSFDFCGLEEEAVAET